MSEVNNNAENLEKGLNIINDNTKDETQEKLKNPKETEEKQNNPKEPVKLWKRIPGFGLMLIIIKNLIGGASDVVVKKIVGIGKITNKSNLLFLKKILLVQIPSI